LQSLKGKACFTLHKTSWNCFFNLETSNKEVNIAEFEELVESVTAFSLFKKMIFTPSLRQKENRSLKMAVAL
jgi:hypothetical protein